MQVIGILIWMVASAPNELDGVVSGVRNLVSQGIPPIEATTAQEVGRYQKSRKARFVDWLPEQRGMLVVTRFAQTNQVHSVAFPRGQRRQLTFSYEPVQWALHCSPQNTGDFLLGRDQGGDEQVQIFRYEAKTNRQTPVSRSRGRYLRPVCSERGDRFAVSGNARNGVDFDVYLGDPKRLGKMRRVLTVQGHWSVQGFSPDGALLLVRQFLSIHEGHLHILTLATGNKRPLTPPGETGVAYMRAAFAKNGKGVYMLTDRGHEFVRLAYQELDASEFSPRFLTPDPKGDVERFDLSTDGRFAAYAVNEDGYSSVYLLALADGRRRKIVGLPFGVVSTVAFQPGGDLLALGISGARFVEDVWTYNTKSHKVTRWTVSEPGDLRAEDLAEPELVHYPTFDKVAGKPRAIPAFLYRPPSRFKGPYPVLVSIHGGPEAQARPVFSEWTNLMVNSLGVAVVSPNIRGSRGYGKSYLRLDNGARRGDAVRDIGALLDWLGTQPDLDDGRVAVSGGSYGGFMTLASMVAYGDKLRCGIDEVGMSSLVTFLENTKAYRRVLRRVEYGDERDPEMRAFLNQLSPLTHVEKIKRPLLVLQGANDPRVPLSEAEQLVSAVRRSGQDVWYLMATDEGHGFKRRHNRDYAELVAVMFLKKYLLPR